MTVQAHDYSTAPFGAWDAPEEPMSDLNSVHDHAVARLRKLGYSAAQAEQFVRDNGTEAVRSESDDLLRARLTDLGNGYGQDGSKTPGGFDPHEHNMEDVLAHVGDDPVLAAQVLVAEQAGKKPRKTLIAQLEELSAPAPETGGGDLSEPEAGAEGQHGESDADNA